jgi:WhiB family transcriptional regulator, redox-sensing transcriptional regulator
VTNVTWSSDLEITAYRDDTAAFSGEARCMTLPTTSLGRDRQDSPSTNANIIKLNTRFQTCSPVTNASLPCQQLDPALWFSSVPAELNLAKAYCRSCPNRRSCLAGALKRAEPTGVWGGEIFERGQIVEFKRPRGRPRKTELKPTA